MPGLHPQRSDLGNEDDSKVQQRVRMIARDEDLATFPLRDQMANSLGFGPLGFVVLAATTHFYHYSTKAVIDNV